MDFGKNRVQYTPRIWTYYPYDQHEVYFYEGGMEIAKYVSRSAQENIKAIEKTFDYKLDGKIQFIVYNKQSDFAQSNIGLSTEQQYNIGGVTQIVGTKVLLYFEGDHEKLEVQIRKGIARILINQMMYGGDLKDMLKNATLLALPDWYIEGLVSYISKEWDVDIDNRVRDRIQNGDYNKFNRLIGIDAVYAGHSIWKYIGDTYGKKVISNVMYMTKVSRNVESAFLFVLGVSIKNLSSEWLASYRNLYSDADTASTLPKQDPVLKKFKKARVYHHVKMNPKGTHLVYVTNEAGQYKLWLHDLEKNKSKKLLKVGHKIDRIHDYSYPLVAWHPSGEIFAYITETKGKLMLSFYTLETGETDTRRIVNFEKILDFAYSDDGVRFAMSAVQNGQSDIYVFTVASNAYEQITKDPYDDLQPRFVNASKEIVFVSNRDNDTIKSQKGQVDMQPTKDLWVYNYETKSPVLKRLTNTPTISESDPADYEGMYIAYLSEENGIKNRYIAYFDSVISHIDTTAHYRYVVKGAAVTNYPRNIIEQDIHVKSKKYAEVIYHDGRYRIYTGDLKSAEELISSNLNLKKTSYGERIAEQQLLPTDSIQQRDILEKMEELKELERKEIEEETEEQEQEQKSSKPGEIDIDNYVFEKGIAPEKKKEKQVEQKIDTKNAAVDTANAKMDRNEFKLASQRNYHINYSTDYIVSQLDNSFLNTSYQKFTGGGSPVYLNPGFSGLFKIGLSDLFEDYRIVGGVRLSGDLNNNEYVLSYDNRVSRLDKQWVLHRLAFMNVSAGANNISLTKVHTHEATYKIKWPFNEVASLRASFNARRDRTVFLAIDSSDLVRPHDFQNWGAVKLEYVFDNTRNRGLNLYNGLRYKLFAEYFRQVDVSETDAIILGADFRHYQKIHRDIIWANRFAASTSLGKQKLIYYMGGVDGWFSPKFDNSINIARDQNYAYQTLATNMRGFYQNIRNGNSFAVINSELRIPIIRYLANRPIKSDFFNNFQIIGFGDVGTAWTGKTPYSEENSLNTTVIGAPPNPIVITLNNQKQPIVGGYGIGLRTRLWGYFVRLDWSWGVEDNVILPRLTYLSFTLDF